MIYIKKKFIKNKNKICVVAYKYQIKKNKKKQMTNRNNLWNTAEWTNTPWTANVNPFSWNVAPFSNNNPYATAVTAFANVTPSTPAANAYENTDSYVFEIAAPGYSKDSFELSYNYPSLTLKATSNTRNENPSNYSYREFNYTSFTREFTLPNNADATDARAKYENGVLTILVPKTTTTNHRTIKIS